MKVKLHSNEEGAAEFTDTTIRQLPMGGYLKRGEDNKIIFDESGYAIIEGGDTGFLKFALINQGYIKEVLE